MKNSPIKNHNLLKTAILVANSRGTPIKVKQTINDPSLTPKPAGAKRETIPITEENENAAKAKN